MALRHPATVSTAPVVAVGLIGGFVAAQQTGSRALGGLLLGAAGAYAGRAWLAKRGPVITGVLSVAYVAAFGLSHPLAKKIGAWPSVLAVSAAAAGSAYALSDRD